MDDAVLQALRQILADHGRAVSEDARRLRGLLSDHCPGHEHEVQALVVAAERRVPPELLTWSDVIPWDVLSARLTRRLVDEAGSDEAAARWAVESWAAVLGVRNSAPPPPVRRPKPPSVPEDWDAEPAAPDPLADLTPDMVSSPADAPRRPRSGFAWWVAALVYTAGLVAGQAVVAWFALGLETADLLPLLLILVAAAAVGLFRSRRDVYGAAARHPDRFVGRALALPWAALMAFYSVGGSLSLFLIGTLGLGLGRWFGAMSSGAHSWVELLAAALFLASVALAVVAWVRPTAGGRLRGIALAWVALLTVVVGLLLVRYFTDHLHGGPAFSLKEAAALLLAPAVLIGAAVLGAWACLVRRRVPAWVVLGMGLAPAGLLGFQPAGWWRQFPMAGPDLTITGHAGQVEGVAFSPDGTRLVSGGLPGNKGGEVKVWDAHNGRLLLNLEGHPHWVNAVAFSPQGRHIASGGGELLRDGEVILWDAIGGRLLRRVAARRDGKPLGMVEDLAFAADGRRLVSVESGHAAGGTVWDLTLASGDASASDVAVLRTDRDDENLTVGGFSADGDKVLTGGSGPGNSGRIVAWDARSGEKLGTITDASGPVYSVGFSPDGKRLVSGDGDGVKVWNLATGQAVLQMRTAGGALRTAFSPDGKWVAGGGAEGTVTLWDGATGREVMAFCAHHGNVRCLAFSPDGKRLATGGYDRTIRVWNLREW